MIFFFFDDDCNSSEYFYSSKVIAEYFYNMYFVDENYKIRFDMTCSGELKFFKMNSHLSESFITQHTRMVYLKAPKFNELGKLTVFE